MAMVFPHHVLLGWQHFGPSIPAVSLEQAFTQPFQLVVQFLHPCSITTGNPADSFPAVTIQRQGDPSFVFLRRGNVISGRFRFPQCLRLPSIH